MKNAISIDENAKNTIENEHKDIENQEVVTIPFTLDNMVDLLTVYNAYLKLEDALRAITEIDPSSGLLWEMRKLDDLLQNLSPIYNPYLDYDDQEYTKIISNRLLTIREKARLLMGE